MTSSPQQDITQTLRLSQAQILTLYTNPFIIVPAEAGFINVFNRATLSYIYKNTPFTNVDNLLSFVLIPPVGSPVTVSNSLNALNILGITQSTSISFSAANPYGAIMSNSSNATIGLTISGSDPTGGDPGSSLSISFTYSIFQL
jgi:hypothetical protein